MQRNLLDYLIITLKGMAIVRQESAKAGLETKEADYEKISPEVRSLDILDPSCSCQRLICYWNR